MMRHGTIVHRTLGPGRGRLIGLRIPARSKGDVMASEQSVVRADGTVLWIGGVANVHPQGLGGDGRATHSAVSKEERNE
jgi:hypothetical protein